MTNVSIRPDDLLKPPEVEDDGVDGAWKRPHRLEPHSLLNADEGLRAYAANPDFDLNDPSSTLILTAKAGGVPIQLYNVADNPELESPLDKSTFPWSADNALVSSYLLPFAEEAERHSSPYCLEFTSSGRFAAGFSDHLTVYDLEAGRDCVLHTHMTTPAKSKRKYEPMTGPRGIISTLAIQSDSSSSSERSSHSILAAGTYSGEVGLFPSAGMQPSTTRLNITRGGSSTRFAGCAGVSSVAWSPCGRYLYVAERNSDGILIYDIRDINKPLGACTGRNARGHQHMQIDVSRNDTENGHDVIAGGVDGYVRVWKDPHLSGDATKYGWCRRLHDDTVGSAIVHPDANVMATCSGSKKFPRDHKIHATLSEQSQAASADSGGEESNDLPTVDGSSPNTQEPNELQKSDDFSLKVWTI